YRSYFNASSFGEANPTNATATILSDLFETGIDQVLNIQHLHAKHVSGVHGLCHIFFAIPVLA
ncbi:MAG: hypothetical protein K0R00_4016, partial [Herbinix sp.]|nr:hypothetical protein [Herbinix sp.]